MITSPPPIPPLARRLSVGFGAVLALWLVAAPLGGVAQAAATVVPLGTAQDFSVLAGSTVTNTGPSTVGANVGVSPGTAITGAGSLTVGGTTHAGNAEALQAQNDLTNAYTNAAGQTPATAVAAELGNSNLVGGVYSVSSAAQLTGELTLNGENDPDKVWVFQIPSALTTASNSSVVLVNNANPCNVFWQVGSSATLGTGTDFVGTVMADQSITMNTGADLEGRALARIGAVTLDTNVISVPTCTTALPTTPVPTTPTPTTPTPTTPTPSTPVPTTPVPTTPTPTLPNPTVPSPTVPNPTVPNPTVPNPTVPVDVPGTPDSPDSPGTPDSPDSPGTPDSPDTPGTPSTPQVPRPPSGSVDAGSTAAPQRDLGLLAAGLSLVGALVLVGSRTTSPHGRHRR